MNATLGAHPVNILTIRDNDPPPAVAFALKDSSGDEGKGPAKIEVSLSEASGKRAGVEYAITGGTAENNTDYTLKNGTLVFEPGELSKSIDIGIVDDKLHEDNETIEVTLSNPVNAVPGKQTVHTYTIIDNDPEPTVAFASPGQEVREDSGKVTVSVNLSAVSGRDVIVPFTLSGTAIDGKNYRVMTPSPLTIRAGAISGDITVALIDDKKYEDTKTIIVTLGTPVNATPGKSLVHRLTIVESDPLPAIAFVMKESNGDEGVTPARLDVALSAASGKRTTVTYAVTGGTAANNRDYTPKNGTLVFEPGELSKSIDIGIIDDKLLSRRQDDRGDALEDPSTRSWASRRSIRIPLLTTIFPLLFLLPQPLPAERNQLDTLFLPHH